jgi:poly-beta-hydroxyalkanoate depolymerase
MKIVYAIAVISAITPYIFNSSLTRSTLNNYMDMEKQISYGIYTIERLPKKTRRTPKWDLHSTAKDRTTAEIHAKTLAAQPYFDCIEIQESKNQGTYCE